MTVNVDMDFGHSFRVKFLQL